MCHSHAIYFLEEWLDRGPLKRRINYKCKPENHLGGPHPLAAELAVNPELEVPSSGNFRDEARRFHQHVPYAGSRIDPQWGSLSANSERHASHGLFRIEKALPTSNAYGSGVEHSVEFDELAGMASSLDVPQLY